MLENSHLIFSGGSHQKIVAICAMLMSITIARCGANLLKPFGSMRRDERARGQAAIELIADMI